jgi:HTH-type transcriptional regulator/antitoxin HigA
MNIDLDALQTTWSAFDRVAHLRPIRDDEAYGRIVVLMNDLIDAVGDNEVHPLAGLLDLVGELVADYEAQHFAIEASEPQEVLQHLMKQNGLRQKDLEDIVPQGNLSAILAGNRQISRAVAKKLAERFNVSVSVFV